MSQLFNKIYLRYHARLILVIVALCGFVSSHLMLKYGKVSLEARYPVAALISYVMFVVLMYLWKVYLEGLPPIQIKQNHQQELQTKQKRSWKDYWDFDFVNWLDGDWHDLLIAVVVVIAFVVLIYTSSYLLFEVPALMIEVILSSLATSFLYRKIKKADDDIFVFKVLKQTWLLGLAMVIFYAVLGIALSASCPNIQRFSEVYSGRCF